MDKNIICQKCIMDNSDPDITFNHGICNHCERYESEKILELTRGRITRSTFKI